MSKFQCHRTLFVELNQLENRPFLANVTMPVRAIQGPRPRPEPRQGDRCGGQLQAPKKLLQTGQVLAKAPEAMQLRYLGTLLNIGENCSGNRGHEGEGGRSCATGQTRVASRAQSGANNG
jgi:hypothetical protein